MTDPMRIRPMFPFYGSKWNIARFYPAPTHDLLIEPFAGSAGYSSFYGARHVLLIDADPIIVGVWQYLISVGPLEIMRLPELEHVGDSVSDFPLLPQEARWLIGFWLNRGSSQPKLTRTAYSARTDRAQLNWSRRAKERIAAQLPLIRDWRAIEAQYTYAPDARATWFVDPPYGDKGRHYRVRMNPGLALGEWCRQRKGQVIVCENDGAEWLPFRTLGSFKATRGRTAEALWTRDA